MRQTYGKFLPGMRLSDLSGKLIVIEGTDGAGRTTQIDLLKPWLEELGHAVLDTGMTRSRLAGDGIRRAKEGNNLGHVTQSLFYATDFIDRLENDIIPALRAGFIVLTDRYIYSLMAKSHRSRDGSLLDKEHLQRCSQTGRNFLFATRHRSIVAKSRVLAGI
jgi:dTMP kinase